MKNCNSKINCVKLINLRKIEHLENQNKTFASNYDAGKWKNFTDKFILFIKLVRKYSKKLNGIIDLINQSNQTHKTNQEKSDQLRDIHKENLLRELFNTIEKFNITIHNQQLIDNILDFTDKNLNNVTKQIIEEFDKQEKEEKLKNKELIKIIEQLEFQIKKLNDQSHNSALNHKNEVRYK
jgi:predicted RND superfamily exporter protein